MSISSPQNRDEFKQYLLTKLGAPVIEINVADEQLDIVIDDAFQYFNERQHFYGTERMYLTTRITSQFVSSFASFTVKETSQSGKNPDAPIPGRPTAVKEGMVSELQLVTPGEGYPDNGYPQDYINTSVAKDLDIDTEDSENIQTDDEDDIVYETSAGESTGAGLTVNIGPQRTTKGGITTVTIYNPGEGYSVGDIVSINGGGPAALFEVTKITGEAPVFENVPIQVQNNYLVLPDDVIGVNEVLQGGGTDLVGIFPGGSVFPILMGGILGNDQACGDTGYSLVSYVAMMEYMATLEFLFFPPIQFNWNQRTHRLFIDSNNFRGGGSSVGGGGGKFLALDCQVKPSPDVYPDLYNDLWLKEYAVALTRCQWGRNLTKFNQVNLPGGITMNGDQILSIGREDLKLLKDRFALDWANPVLDEVG